jgi:ferric-dicitrate binding protein FerR (iron transport regulator)
MDYTPSELIIGYFKKSLDQEGMDEFYQWVNENPDNKKLFFETKTIFDAVSYSPVLDINDSWQRLLGKKTTERLNKRTFLWKHISKYAAVASIAIILTSAAFFSFFNNNEFIPPSPEYITGNGIQSDMVILPDGTKVNIGSKTNFRFAPDYGKKDRIVYLEGEAYFDVVRHKDKPFIVKVNGQDIEALGTKFNVMAYASDSIYTTTLLEGSVSLSTRNITKKTILKPDQQFTYNKNNLSVTVSEVDASLYTAWVNGYYYFSDQNLKLILNKLSDIYGVTFEISSETLINKKFTGTFYRGQSVKNILEIINLSIPIKYEMKEQHIVIKENKSNTHAHTP